MTTENNAGLWRTIRALRSQERLIVAGAAYVLAGVFFVVLMCVRFLAPSWPWSAALALAGAITAPLVLAFVYDRLTALKTPWFEITLSQAAAGVDARFAGTLLGAVDLQDSVALEDPSLLLPIDADFADEFANRFARGGAAEIVSVDLARWWSTRLFLLAALTDDFTGVRQIVFLDGGAHRRYVGLATPRAVRRALAARAPGLDQAYLALRSCTDARASTTQQVYNVIKGWDDALYTKYATAEEGVKEFVTAANVGDWLAAVLDTSRLEWDGFEEDARLRSRILRQDADYCALVQQGRLELVVNRDALAVAIARATVRNKTP